MSTASEKELAAASLRVYAEWVESALDSIPALSASAWDCPAADAFVAGVVDQQAGLDAAASTMRSIATALEATAEAQRAAELAAAEAAAAAASAVGDLGSPDPAPAPPVNVF